MTETCPLCGNSVEVHREGWLYDHTITGKLDGDICRGSGTSPPGGGEREQTTDPILVIAQSRRHAAYWAIVVAKLGPKGWAYVTEERQILRRRSGRVVVVNGWTGGRQNGKQYALDLAACARRQGLDVENVTT